ncbi:MAG: hypothetical protein IMZ50_16370 [Candidatus Atribacteria bacterium]|nr:hypothetical protein [Candidatus Atribacteria bacterium]
MTLDELREKWGERWIFGYDPQSGLYEAVGCVKLSCPTEEWLDAAIAQFEAGAKDKRTLECALAYKRGLDQGLATALQSLTNFGATDAPEIATYSAGSTAPAAGEGAA